MEQRDVVERARSGDREAFDVLVSANIDRLFVGNLRLGDGSTTTAPKTAHAIATWLGTLPFVETTTPVALTLAGKSGFMLDVSLPGSPKPECGAGACEALLTSQPLDRFEFGVVGTERARLFLLDLPDGTVLMVTIDAASGTSFDEVIGVAMPVVESLTFEGPASSSAP